MVSVTNLQMHREGLQARSMTETMTFDLNSSRDMLRKLNRELERIRNADPTDREGLADHGINLAVTAWHLAEWVWSDIKGRTDLRIWLAKKAGIKPQEFSKRAFKTYLANEWPELGYCQVIATSSKHVGCDVEYVEAAGTSARSTPHGPASETDISTPAHWVLKLTIGDERIEALPVFETVSKRWTAFIGPV